MGHVGVALAMRSTRGAPPLWLLVLAAQGPDWMDVLWGLAGYRWVNPAWSPHGFVWLAGGCGLVAAIAARTSTDRGPAARSAVLAGVAYLSHWITDFVTGSKPTWPGGPMVGLGWYGRPALDFAVEAAVIGVGWRLWRGSSPSARREAMLSWTLLATLLGLQLAADLIMAKHIRTF